LLWGVFVHVANRELALSLPGRNLALAEQMGLNMVTPCPACFLHHKTAQYELKSDPGLKNKIEQNIEMPLNLSRSAKHILSIIHDDAGTALIKEKIKTSLKGLKAVTYYGCYLVRPPQITEFDDPENPVVMDKIMEALGIEIVDCRIKSNVAAEV